MHWLLDVPMNDVHSGSYKYYYYRHCEGKKHAVMLMPNDQYSVVKSSVGRPGTLISSLELIRSDQ